MAIPHGMIEDRYLIHHTGVTILQLPEGVECNGWPGSALRVRGDQEVRAL